MLSAFGKLRELSRPIQSAKPLLTMDMPAAKAYLIALTRLPRRDL